MNIFINNSICFTMADVRSNPIKILPNRKSNEKLNSRQQNRLLFLHLFRGYLLDCFFETIDVFTLKSGSMKLFQQYPVVQCVYYFMNVFWNITAISDLKGFENHFPCLREHSFLHSCFNACFKYIIFDQ